MQKKLYEKKKKIAITNSWKQIKTWYKFQVFGKLSEAAGKGSLNYGVINLIVIKELSLAEVRKLK